MISQPNTPVFSLWNFNIIHFHKTRILKINSLASPFLWLSWEPMLLSHSDGTHIGDPGWMWQASGPFSLGYLIKQGWRCSRSGDTFPHLSPCHQLSMTGIPETKNQISTLWLNNSRIKSTVNRSLTRWEHKGKWQRKQAGLQREEVERERKPHTKGQTHSFQRQEAHGQNITAIR